MGEEARIPNIAEPQTIQEIIQSQKDQKRGAQGKRHGSVTDSLFELIKIKDPRTGNHCRAVAYYANLIGKEAGFDKSQLKTLSEGARLHDIGKIMIDNALLDKKGKLKERELMQLHQHAELGMRILESFHMSQTIIDMAWHHHERHDGEGYPDGLCGDDISVFTKIISVADIIDAMATDRPYRKHLMYDELLKEMHRAKGTQLDPEFTDIAIRLLEKGMMDLS